MRIVENDHFNHCNIFVKFKFCFYVILVVCGKSRKRVGMWVFTVTRVDGTQII